MPVSPNSTLASLSDVRFERNRNATASLLQGVLETPGGPGITAITDFLLSSLPPGWNATGPSGLDLNTTLLQFYQANMNPLPQKYLDLAISACRAELCLLLTGPSEPDVAGIGIMWAQYVQLGVTAVYVLLFVVDSTIRLRHRNWQSRNAFLAHISESLKACVRMSVDFARTMGLGLCVAVLVASSDSRYTWYSIKAGAFAATAFSASFFTLEFISWAWIPFDAPYYVIPAATILPILTLIGISNSQGTRRTGASSHFFELCIDLQRVDAVTRDLHHVLLVLCVPDLACFLAWVVLRVARARRGTTRAGCMLAETVLQIAVVVLTLATQAVLLAFFAASRATAAHMLGEQNAETQWTLGQILSLTAFLPVVLESGPVVLKGLEGAWRWRLLEGWIIRREEEEQRAGPDDVEMAGLVQQQEA